MNQKVSSRPVALLCITAALLASTASLRAQSNLALNTTAVSPHRFLAVHGRRALIDGYSENGLEAWAYPLQLVRNYRPGFRVAGTTSEIPGAAILRRIAYRPQSILRTYIGPNFIVRETLFIPLDKPAIIITYTLESKQPLDIVIHFVPVLNLMWPAAIGGQDTSWNPAAHAYVLSEPTHRFAALIGSNNIVAHDEIFNIANSAVHGSLAFTVRAAPTATVVLASLKTIHDNPIPALTDSTQSLEQSATEHYTSLLASALQIETPDPVLNRDLAWSTIALDQAWVCNPYLGCGIVAGYGPSRGARRPQYAWFFAGDGMVATRALVSAGEYARARDELRFIARYQDKKTGMVWHEMSQSAGLIDWVGKYPYMFVHIDISFQYLNAMANYISASGDKNFLNQQWPSIQAAYRYCESLIDPADGLPRIPANKEGGDEQDRMSDALTLSAAWVRASASFARMAAWSDHSALAKEAEHASAKARASFAPRYWNSEENFWIDGRTPAGKPIFNRALSGDVALAEHLFSPHQEENLLNQLASPNYQTDWGTRGIPLNSKAFSANSYAKGSVWATGTAALAVDFWRANRPAEAFSIWSGLLPWLSLDSLGHMNEVLAGDFYHQQTESVPEQTWSSADFLHSTVRGLLGLQIESIANRIVFAPRIPAGWNTLAIRNIRLPHSTVALALTRTPQGFELATRNDGPHFHLLFQPQLPLGATLERADLNRKSIHASLRQHPHGENAQLEIEIPSGTATLHLRYTGGISLLLPPSHPLVGNPSRNIKAVQQTISGNRYVLDAQVDPAHPTRLKLVTPWKIAAVHGATQRSLGPDTYQLTIPAANPQPAESRYVPAKVEVTFQKLR